jgi:hypothetical protein
MSRGAAGAAEGEQLRDEQYENSTTSERLAPVHGKKL